MTHTLSLERIIDAPAKSIWQCWTTPHLLEQWFCPRPWKAADAIIDLRPGGEFSCIMNGPDGASFPNQGVILEVIPTRKLVTTDAFQPDWSPSSRAFMVSEINLTPLEDGKTQYTAKAHHWTAEAKAEHEAMGFEDGWGAAADQLAELAKSL